MFAKLKQKIQLEGGNVEVEKNISSPGGPSLSGRLHT